MCQTLNNIVKERGITTAPPPMKKYCNTVTQWDVFDTYMEEYEKEKAEMAGQTHSKKLNKQEDTLYSSEMRHYLKLMERMVSLLIEDDAYWDNKYYEDKSDEVQTNKGSLLPL